MHSDFRYLSTPDGPMLEGASPQRLRELLEQYEAALTSLGSPVADYLNPGISRLEIDAKLSSRGLRCPEELVVWFRWHNGVVRRPGILIGGLPVIRMATLDEALKTYDDSRGDLELALSEELDYDSLTYGAGEGWLRLETSSEAVAVECNEPGDAPPRIRSANVSFAERETELTDRAVSLCTPISRWIQAAERGAFTWMSDDYRWTVDIRLVPSDLTKSILG